MKYAWMGWMMLGLLAGCATMETRSGSIPKGGYGPVFLDVLANATPEQGAGQAVSSIVGSVLTESGWKLVGQQKESSDALGEAPPADAMEGAKKAHARWLISGVVHEYRYKTDLDGHPAVGVTLRAIDTKTGQVAWQGSVARTGFGYASLSAATQSGVLALVRRMSIELQP